MSQYIPKFYRSFFKKTTSTSAN